MPVEFRSVFDQPAIGEAAADPIGPESRKSGG